ncbi:MAG TPA: putative Ig domain-containing protein, partial [Usitatibacter sp.]|nr:putative Ig domain-containing protein [Usitatibacter sp.]
FNASGQAIYTPTLCQSGTDTFGYQGTGPGGSTTVRVARVVIAAPPAPAVTSASVGGFVTGSSATTYQVITSNCPISFSAPGLAALGLSISSSGLISGTPTPGSVGTFPITVTASGAGGPGPSGTITITITQGPVPSITNAVTSFTATQNAAITPYQITTNIAATSYAVTPPLPTGLTLNTSTGLISGTPTGVSPAATYTLTASNGAGTGPGFALSITVQMPAPVITSANVASASESNPFSYQITASNPPITAFNVTGTLPAGVTANAAGLISGTPAPGSAGIYSVSISATNSTGTGAPITLTITVSASAPTIAGPISVVGQTGVAFNYQVVAANLPTSFAATGLPPGLTINTTTGLISGTPTTLGTFPGTVTASNASGTSNPATVITITIGLGPPVITSGGTASGAAGFPFTYQIVATNTPTSYGASGLPPGVTVNTTTGLISGTPGANGVYNATVTATNSVTTASRAVTITIAFGIPVVNSAATASTASGAAFTYQITATNAPVTYGASGLPAGLSVDPATGLISGAPDDFGVFIVTLTAGNSSGTGSGVLTLTVTQSSVRVTSASAITGSIGTPLFYQVTVASGPASVSASAMPPGLTFDALNQRIVGTPTRGGTYTVTLSVANTVGSTTFTLTINIGFEPASVADLAVDVVYETARAITLPITGDVTSVTIVTLPEHGLVSVQGNIATYTPAVGYSGDDSFTYTASNPAGTTAVATVRISIGGLVPVANAAAMTVALNTAATADLAGFIKASGLTGVSIGVQPAHGTVTVNGTKVTYTPRTDFFGADSFTYIAFGNAGKSTPATVSVSVVGRPNAAEARDVAAIVDSQVQAARRFSGAQVGNFQRRMETLHRGRDVQPRASDAPAAAAAPAPQARASEDADAKPVRVATTGLIPVSLFAPLMNAAATRSLDVAASTGGDGARGFVAGTNIWVGGTAQFGRRDADGEISGLRFSTDGVSVGIDRRFSERLVLGLGVGFGRDESVIGSHGSRNKARAHSFALYGSFQPSVETFVDMLVGLGRIEFDSTRHVEAVNQFATGSRNGEQAFASLTAGAEFRRDGVMISPYGRIDVSRDRLKAYSEGGASLYSLTYHEQRVNSSQLAMGVRAETQHDTDFGRVVPRLRLEYRRQLDGQHGASVSYADLINGPEYALGTAGTSRNALLLGVGSDFLLRGGLKLGVDYMAQRSSGASNVQSVRLLVSQDLDGRGLPSWTWQPKMFKDPIGVEFGYSFDDNVTRGRWAGEKLADRSYALSLGEPIPIKLGNLANLRLMVTPSVTGEKFQRYAGLGRFSAGVQAELQYRASGAFDATTFSLVGRANYDQFESDHRTGPRYFAGINARRSLTDRIDVFAEVGANARNGRSEVFTLRDYSAKLNLDYSLGKRGVLYLAGEYRRGDTVSTGAASLVNIGLSEVFVPDDAFDGRAFFAYRFDARTVLGTIGWNYPLGPRDSLDFSWRRVQATPTHRPSFDGGGPLRYIDNQYSIVYLMRF